MNPDIRPHELANMRIAADKAPFSVQQKFHALLDAYEDLEGGADSAETLNSKRSKAVEAFRDVYPAARAERWTPPEEPLSEDAWNEKLEDCETPEERAAVTADEVERARAAEVELRERVEKLEGAIENALSELE